MKLKLPAIQVDEEKPYENDLLDRKPFGDALTNLVLAADSEFTLSIDGQWGDGKTTFAKMWIGQLRSEELRVIYFDAFSHDYGDDPFIPLSAEIIETLSTSTPEDGVKLKELGQKAAKIGIKILKIGGRIAVRVATVGTVGDTELKAATDIIDAAASEVTDKAVGTFEKHLEDFHISQSEIDGFRGLLREVANRGNSKGPLIIILDELDRCQPAYAVSLLEKVKHFFSVDGVVFVFVLNSKQMVAAIEKIYGRGIDARQYLHKFIDVETRLPSKENLVRGPSHYKTYTRYLLDNQKFQSFGDATNLYEVMPDLAKAFDLSLRDLEKSCRNLLLFYNSVSDRQLHISSIAALISVLKVADHDAYDTIREGGSPMMSVIEKLRGTSNLDYVRNWLLACLGQDDLVDKDGKDFISHAIQMEQSVDLERTKFLQYHCAKMDYFA